PVTLRPNQAFAVSATVANRGRGRARRSAVRFYLQAGARKIALDGVGATKALRRGRRAGGTARLVVPGTIAPGTYRLLACADGLAKVRERNEANNCRAARGTVRIGAAAAATSQSGPVAGP